MTTQAGPNRVIRGGSWNNNAVNLRSANRNNDDPGKRNSNVGLRLVSTRNRQEGSSTDYPCVHRPRPGHHPAPISLGWTNKLKGT